MEDVNILDWASLVLVIVGALNWGLEGLGQLAGEGTNLNLVEVIFTQTLGIPVLEAGVYLLVGLAGLYQVYFGYQLYDQQ